MLSLPETIDDVTPWQVIEEALLRLRPPRNKEWLSAQLSERGKNVSPQGIGNWKDRGVPPSRFIELGEILGLEVRQVAGIDPLPWDKAEGWPFPDIDQHRLTSLSPTQIGEVQAKVRELLEKYEQRAAEPPGKYTPSPPGAGRRNNGR